MAAVSSRPSADPTPARLPPQVSHPERVPEEWQVPPLSPEPGACAQPGTALRQRPPGLLGAEACLLPGPLSTRTSLGSQRPRVQGHFGDIHVAKS